VTSKREDERGDQAAADLLDAFGRRRPPNKVEARESSGADAAAYQAEHPPAPRADHATEPDARVIVEARADTRPGVGPGASAPTEEPVEEPAPGGVETSPSAQKRERRVWVLALVAALLVLGVVLFVLRNRSAGEEERGATSATVSNTASAPSPPTSSLPPSPPPSTTASALTPNPTQSSTGPRVVAPPHSTLSPTGTVSAPPPPVSTSAPSTTPSGDPLLTGH